MMQLTMMQGDSSPHQSARETQAELAKNRLTLSNDLTDVLPGINDAWGYNEWGWFNLMPV